MGFGLKNLPQLMLGQVRSRSLAPPCRATIIACDANSPVIEPSASVEEMQRWANFEEQFDVRSLAGVSAPLGFWDPVGFSTSASQGRVRFYREVEIKHGRVAMLAAVGFPLAEQFHPLFGGNVDVPSYIAFQQTPLQTFWPLVLAAVSAFEVRSISSFDSPISAKGFYALLADDQAPPLQVEQSPFMIKADHIPGDLGFDPLGLQPQSKTELLAMQTKELNNGRLAMIAMTGMVVQELVTGAKLF